MNHARIFDYNLPAVGGQQHQKGEPEGMSVPESAEAAFFPGTAQPLRQHPNGIQKPQGHARKDQQAFEQLEAVLPDQTNGLPGPHSGAQQRYAAQKSAQQVLARLCALRPAKQIPPGQPERQQQYAGRGQRLQSERTGRAPDQLIQKASRVHRVRVQLSSWRHLQPGSEGHQKRCQRGSARPKGLW